MIKKWIFYTVTSILVFVILVLSIVIYAFNKNKNEKYNEILLKDIVQELGDLPIIEINTINEKLPKDKENYVNCSFTMYNTEEGKYDFSVTMKEKYGEEDSVGIRLRGNSTLNQPKNSYRIKFENKQLMLGLTAAKSWVLLADYFDTSKIKNYTALTMGNKIFDNLGFTPTPNHVVLAINGVFKGLYLLTEQIDENKGRTDIETDIDSSIAISGTNYDFPFLIELSSKDYTDGINGFNIEGLGDVEIKYPDLDEGNIVEYKPVYDYIKEYISAIYSLLKNGGMTTVSFRTTPVSLSDLIDIDSMVDFYLINELMLNRDACHYSININKKVGETALMGPIWDFDTSQELQYDNTAKYNNSVNKLCLAYNSPIFNNFVKNPDLYQKIQYRWLEVEDDIVNFVNFEMKNYKENIYAAARYDMYIWTDYSLEVGSNIFCWSYDECRMFIIDRVEYLTRVYNYNHTAFLNELVANNLPY